MDVERDVLDVETCETRRSALLFYKYITRKKSGYELVRVMMNAI